MWLSNGFFAEVLFQGHQPIIEPARDSVYGTLNTSSMSSLRL